MLGRRPHAQCTHREEEQGPNIGQWGDNGSPNHCAIHIFSSVTLLKPQQVRNRACSVKTEYRCHRWENKRWAITNIMIPLDGNSCLLRRRNKSELKTLQINFDNNISTLVIGKGIIDAKKKRDAATQLFRSNTSEAAAIQLHHSSMQLVQNKMNVKHSGKSPMTFTKYHSRYLVLQIYKDDHRQGPKPV